MCSREEATEGATLFTFGLGRRSGDLFTSGIGVSLDLRRIDDLHAPKRPVTAREETAVRAFLLCERGVLKDHSMASS